MFVSFSLSVKAQNVYYVADDGNPSADGLSWATATTLEAVIPKLASANNNRDHVFVKKGTYIAPEGNGFYFSSAPSKKYATFYGNCDGTESLTHLPNPTGTIETYLKAANSGSEDLDRVMSIDGGILNFTGFDLSGGDASKATFTKGYGGTIYNSGGTGAFKYCKIHGGKATQGAGAYIVLYGAPVDWTLENCEIYDNESSDMGGGLYLGSSTKISNCLIRDNISGKSGGGIRMNNSNQAAIFNSTIINNNAGGAGGGIYHMQGDIVNCLIANNTGSSGAGGIQFHASGRGRLINSTIVNNKVIAGGEQGGGISVASGIVKNCIAWGNTIGDGATKNDIYAVGNNDSENNTSMVEYSCFESISVKSGFNYAATVQNNLAEGTDPLFTDAGSNDFTLQPMSPCKDAGDNDAYDAEYPDKDLNNQDRIIDSIIDMGAYEATENTVGMQGPASGTVCVYSSDKGLLTVNSNGNVAIYDMCGRVQFAKALSGATDFQLPAGLYIITINGRSYKVIVK